MSHSLKTGETGVKAALGTDDVWQWFDQHPNAKMRFSKVLIQRKQLGLI